MNFKGISYGGGSLVVPIASAGARRSGFMLFLSNFALKVTNLGTKTWKIV